MKTIYFVTEGVTDQIILESLVERWMGNADFAIRLIQPPSSEYARELDSLLSQGWKGVTAWCSGKYGAQGRDEVLRRADCLIVHVDADVATDPDFRNPPFAGLCPPASDACDWVRKHLSTLLGTASHPYVVFCVPSKDIEAWVLCALLPEVADRHAPVECRNDPAALLVERTYNLVRRKDGRLRKNTSNYRRAASAFAAKWENCPTRCDEAERFENDIRRVLGV
jgi:hypothetical protein